MSLFQLNATVIDELRSLHGHEIVVLVEQLRCVVAAASSGAAVPNLARVCRVETQILGRPRS
jgi:hypothetical protein